MYQSLHADTPCVVVAQSGGAATDLYEVRAPPPCSPAGRSFFLRPSSRAAVPARRRAQYVKRKGALPKRGDGTLKYDEEHTRYLDEIKEMNAAKGDLLLTFFDVTDDAADRDADLSHFLLEAVVNLKLHSFDAGPQHGGTDAEPSAGSPQPPWAPTTQVTAARRHSTREGPPVRAAPVRAAPCRGADGPARAPRPRS